MFEPSDNAALALAHACASANALADADAYVSADATAHADAFACAYATAHADVYSCIMADHQENLPDDPATQLQAGLAQAHEYFLTCLEKGFSPSQALYLVASVLCGRPGAAPPD